MIAKEEPAYSLRNIALTLFKTLSPPLLLSSITDAGFASTSFEAFSCYRAERFHAEPQTDPLKRI